MNCHIKHCPITGLLCDTESITHSPRYHLERKIKRCGTEDNKVCWFYWTMRTLGACMTGAWVGKGDSALSEYEYHIPL